MSVLSLNGYTFDTLNNTLTISSSFAKKASKVGSLEYNIILKLRRDFPNLTIKPEEKRESKKGLTYAQMETFIGQHRNADELRAKFEKVKKLSRVQPMPYKYVKTWFENNFPYYSEQPAFDADGYVIDPDDPIAPVDLMREISIAHQLQASSVIETEASVA